MRYTESFGKTQKEVPKDVTIASHQLLIRGGFIHQLAAGLYNFLPLGFRVLMKIDQIIKEELSRSGVQHLLMPLVHPASLWKESGRYDKVDVLLKFRSKHGTDCVLAPTHEETITDLARKYIKTYKDLPVILNQNQWKYRDEVRATGGLLRTREFLMQDAYSFDRDKKGLDQSFRKVSEAYHRIFQRIGLDITVVKADSGTMGGSDSEEFMVVADVGEDKILSCNSCPYRANQEKAVSRFEAYAQDKKMKPMKKVKGEGIIGVEELAKFLDLKVHQTTKTILFQADKNVVAVMIRGDCDISEVKLKNFLGCMELNLASHETVKKLTGAEVGYAGPVNLPDSVRVVADLTCKSRVNFEAGANETHFHNINVNFEIDFPTPEFVDVREAKEGDGCVECDGVLKMLSAIEAGHVFKLGRVYSEKMGANFIDEDGKSKPMEMGCYGIGISRLVAAVVEALHDDGGIVWPIRIAPYQIHLVSVGNEDGVSAEADKLYKGLTDAGHEVLFDDRKESPGVKFKDADLIGIPLRLVVSKRTMEKDCVEWKLRNEKNAEMVSTADLTSKIKKFLSQEN